MQDVIVQLRYSVDRKKWSRYERVELTIGENHYFLPPIHEYFNSINLDIDIRTRQVQVIPVQGLKEIHPGKHYQLNVRRDGGGRTGIRRFQLGFQINRATYFLKIVLPLHPDNLKEDHFHAMLDDISHWIFFELAASVKLDIEYTNKFSQALRSQQVILNLIKKRMAEIETILQQIALSPKQQIEKQYYRTINIFERQDSTTLRLANRNPDAAHTFAFRNISSYDVYENRFILFFFNQLERRLSFLQRIADRTIEDIENEITRVKGWGNSIEIENLTYQKQEAEKFSQECQDLRSRLYWLQELEFLREINFIPSQFRLNYSLALTQDFNYGRIFAFYRELARQEEIKRLDRIRDFTEGLVSLGVKTTWQIYEYWTFFALYQVLVELHFKPKNEAEILQIIKSDVLAPGLESGKFVALTADKQIYGDLTILLYYEKRYRNRNGKEIACPDITMEVRQGREVKQFLFDAKYKTYTGKIEENNKTAFWKDFRTISTKYGPKSKIDQSNGAFLFHTNTHNLEFENYGAFVQQKEGGAWQPNNHDYGYIPVVPGNVTSLKMLLAMIFLVKLDKRPRMCWLCGSTDIRWDGDPNSWKKCLNCGNDWRETHCGGCGFSPLYRNDKFTFQFRHEHLQESSKCGYSICPHCGMCGKCKMSIDEILERK